MAPNREDLRDAQIDPEHGKEPIVDIPLLNTYLSINKVHALQLGTNLGAITALVYVHSPLLGALLLFDIALSAIGISITANLTTLTIPNYAYTYTVRANPWYYLTALLLAFTTVALSLL